MDEVEGFARLEREAVRRAVPSFDWMTYAAPSPRQPLRKPLGEARLGLVTTSGASLRSQPPFDAGADAGDPGFRVIPRDSRVEELRFDHAGYDVRSAYADPAVVFPLELLRRDVEEGRLGALAERAYALMGYITQYDVLLDETGPAIASAMAEDQVDLALLVPA